MRQPKCKIGRSKHQPIGENADIQRNKHCRIIQPAEMNCIINFHHVNVVILRTSRLRAGHVRCLIQTITCHRIYAQPRSRGASG